MVTYQDYRRRAFSWMDIARDPGPSFSWERLAHDRIDTVCCPYCFTESGACRTKSGKVAQSFHAARVDVAYGRRAPGFLIREEPW